MAEVLVDDRALQQRAHHLDQLQVHRKRVGVKTLRFRLLKGKLHYRILHIVRLWAGHLLSAS